MGGRQVDGGKTGEMMEVLAQGDLDSLWQPGSEGTGLGHQIPHPLLCPQQCRRAVLPLGLRREGSMQGTNTTLGRP